VVAQTLLADKITAYAAGNLTQAQFEAATTPQALDSAVSAASLPGAPVVPVKKSNAVALGVGLGVGLGVPVVCGAVAAYWWFYVRAGAAASSGLAQPML